MPPSSTELDPWHQPPDWMPLRDISKLLGDYRGITVLDRYFAWSMIEAVRGGVLLHRVDHPLRQTQPKSRGVAADGRWWREAVTINDLQALPEGLCWSEGFSEEEEFCVQVRNWAQVDPHWKDGTVGGFDNNGIRQRHTLTVFWRQVLVWVGPHLARLRSLNFDATDVSVSTISGQVSTSESLNQARLKRASDEMVREKLRSLYAFAKNSNMKPPNLIEIRKPIKASLGGLGFFAPQSLVDGIADEPEFREHRRKSGLRLHESFLTAFSSEGWEKARPES